ncbi:hypothetical protein E0L93_14590 [Rubrobacter taiwanensis]|uniref:Uncharacterized protein n=1 Tax=Rubrobacter taiwanensis TaxID=185139 RepID=A0A4R1B9Q9_9ACTN|nr:hypothetical protein [Rubrobacter taiwanensis]TCJ13643.1 hypothetical protein E0L93_14590 [Rubrobacter taiwanensis]
MESVHSAALAVLLQLVALYALGSYALSHLGGMAYGSSGRRLIFYLFVAPGVILHETAHYLACLATGTRVAGFAPFKPGVRPDGRIQLGYVRHARRGVLVEAFIGLAPLLLNSLGVWLVTMWLTPVNPSELVGLGAGEMLERLRQAFEQPLLGALWLYVAGSFALGAVPSQEDLVGAPAALIAGGALVLSAGALSPQPALEAARLALSGAFALLLLPTLLAGVLAILAAVAGD